MKYIKTGHSSSQKLSHFHAKACAKSRKGFPYLSGS